MSTENDSIAVDHDVSREAILEAVQKARSNEGFLNTDTPPERDQPAAEDPAEAPDDLAEQQIGRASCRERVSVTV